MDISIKQLKTLNSAQIIELHNAYCEDVGEYIFFTNIQKWLERDPILNLSDELKEILVEFAD